ncbi:hypothetical protein D1007_61537 [Hordeum vulgare]|nr:hypothetical protein D1007_61537 [Hordeum vulgare]
MGFDDADAGGDEVEACGAEAYNCPFCGVDFDFVGLCCHINDEHAVEAKSRNATTAELASLQGQVSGAASLMEQATNKAREARGLQLQRLDMFLGLERRVRRGLGFICTVNVSSPLVPDESIYLDFFTKVAGRLEAGAREVGALIVEETRDLVSQALTSVLSNFFHNNPHFNFKAMMAPVPEASRDILGKVIGDHVDMLSAQFAPNGFDCQGVPWS